MKYIFGVVFFVTLWRRITAQTDQATTQCSLGCSNCQYSSLTQGYVCLGCTSGFTFNSDQNICISNNCQENQYLQVRPDSENICVAICDDLYEADSITETCKKLSDCNQSYSSVAVLSNNSILMAVIPYSEEFILTQYDGFFNFIAKSTGEYVFRLDSDTAILLAVFFNDSLLAFEVNQLYLWQIHLRKTIQLAAITNGQLSSASQIFEITDQCYYVTSFDLINKLTFFNILSGSLTSGSLLVLENAFQLSSSNGKVLVFDSIIAFQSSSDGSLAIYSMINTSDSNCSNYALKSIALCTIIPLTSTVSQILHLTTAQVVFIRVTDGILLYRLDLNSNICTSITVSTNILKLHYLLVNQVNQEIILMKQNLLVSILNSSGNIIKQIQTNSAILDIACFWKDTFGLVEILTSTSVFEYTLVASSYDSYSLNQTTTITVKISNPLSLHLVYYSTNDNSISTPDLFVTSLDFQKITLLLDLNSPSTSATSLIFQSYKQSINSNTGYISQIIHDVTKDMLFACSLDGVLSIWSLSSMFEAIYFSEFVFPNESCRDLLVFQGRIIAVSLGYTIIVFDMFSPENKQVFSQPDGSYISVFSLKVSDDILVIFFSSCFYFIDGSMNEIFHSCSSAYSMISQIDIRSNLIYAFSPVYVTAYLVNYQAKTMTAINQISDFLGIFSYFKLQTFNKEINNQAFVLLFNYRTKNFLAYDADTFSQVVNINLSLAITVMDADVIYDTLLQQYRFNEVYYSSVLNDMFRFKYVTHLLGDSTYSTILGLSFVSTIFKSTNYQNEYNQTINRLFSFEPLSYTSFTIAVNWNNSTQFGFVETPTYLRDQNITLAKYNPSKNTVFIGSTSGFLGRNPLITVPYPKLTKVIDFPQYSIIQIDSVAVSYQIRRYFLIGYSVLEFDLYDRNVVLDEMLFDSSLISESVQGFSVNNNLHITAAFKSTQLILKSYTTMSSQQFTVKSGFTIISNYFISERLQAIFIFGSKLSKFDLTLSNEVVILPSVSVKYQYCVFPEGLIVCLTSSYSLLIIRETGYILMNTVVINGIETGALLTYDPKYKNIFIYKQTLLVYSFAGILKATLSESTSNIIELNLYGSNIVVITKGYGIIYSRSTLAFLANFLSPASGNIVKTLYAASTNNILYFSDLTSNGQIFVFSLTFLLDLTPIRTMYDSTFLLANMSFEEETQMILIMLKDGNISTFYLTGMTSDSPIYTSGYLSDPPDNFYQDYLSNSILAYNKRYAILFNYQVITRTIIRLFDPNKGRAVVSQSTSSSSPAILIADSSNILSVYQNYSQRFLSSFDSSIVSLRLLSDNQTILVQFREMIYVYLQGVQLNGDFQVTPSSYSYIMPKVRVSKFLTDEIFVTSDQVLYRYDFQNNKQILSYQFSQTDMIKTGIFVLTINKIIIGSALGVVYILNLSDNSVQSIQLASVSTILDIILIKDGYFISQANGKLTILTSSFSISQTIDLVALTDYQTTEDVPFVDLGFVKIDILNNRYFAYFQREKRIAVIDLTTHKLLLRIGFPHDEYNRMFISDNYILLYTTADVIGLDRKSLFFSFEIRSNIRLQQITELIFLNENIIILTFLKKYEIYLINTSTSSVILVESILTSFPIVYSAKYTASTNSIVIIGSSTTNIFEKRYSLDLFINSSTSCSSVIAGSNSIFALKQLQIIQSMNTSRKQLFYLSLSNNLDMVNAIEQTSTSIVLKSDTADSTLNISADSFLVIKSNAYLKNFKLIFQDQDVYTFSNSTKSIFLQDIIIEEQSLQNTTLSFVDKTLVVISGLTIQSISSSFGGFRGLQSSSSESSSFLSFVNCQTVEIYGLQIIDVNWGNSAPFIHMQGVQKVILKDLGIYFSRFISLISLENSSEVEIENATVNSNTGQFINEDSPCVALKVSGSVLTHIKNITAILNVNIKLLDLSNQYSYSSEIIELKMDVMTVIGITAMANSRQPYIYLNDQNDFPFISIHCSTATISNVAYDHNYIQILVNKTKNIVIQDSTFTHNSNIKGGAIRVLDVGESISFKNCTFSENAARASGGAIYFENVVAINMDALTTIKQNSALIGGGIRVMYQDIDSNIQGVLEALSDNKAEIYGDNYGSYIVGVVIEKDTNTGNSNGWQDFTFERAPAFNDDGTVNKIYALIGYQQFASGSSCDIRISYLDSSNQKAKIQANRVKIQGYPSSILAEIATWYISVESSSLTTVQVNGESQANYNQFNETTNQFVFSDMVLNGQPATNQTLLMQCQIYPGKAKFMITMNINFRECEVGEIYKQFSETIQTCFVCKDGFYQLSKPVKKSNNYESCNKCPSEAEICSKDEIKLKQGYWRVSNTTSTAIFCENREESCNETDPSSIDGCVAGHIGPLCEQCDSSGRFWGGLRYASNDSYDCSLCSSEAVQYTALIFSILLMELYLIMQVFIFVQSFSYHQRCYYLRILNLLPVSVSQLRDQNSFYVKCLITYLQLQSIIVEFNVNVLPNIFKSAPTYFGKPGSKLVVNMLCLFSSEFLDSFKIGKIKLLISSIVPFICLGITVVIFLLMEKARFSKFTVKAHVKYTAVNFLFLFFQSDAINTLTSFLTCRKIGDISYMTDDLQFQCNDPSYANFKDFFALPLLLFWILIPLVFLFLLKKRKNKLDYCSTIYHLGSYYVEYRRESYYWEFVRTYFKVGIIIFYTLCKENRLFAHMGVIFFISSYQYILARASPLLTNRMMKCEQISFQALTAVIVLQNLTQDYANTVLEWLFAVTHLSFVIYMLTIIISIKLFRKQNYFGKLFLMILQKIVNPKLFERFTRKTKDIQFSTFLKWKKIRNNLKLLTNQKAIDRITKHSEAIQNSIVYSDNQPEDDRNYIENFVKINTDQGSARLSIIGSSPITSSRRLSNEDRIHIDSNQIGGNYEDQLQELRGSTALSPTESQKLPEQQLQFIIPFHNNCDEDDEDDMKLGVEEQQIDNGKNSEFQSESEGVKDIKESFQPQTLFGIAKQPDILKSV